WQCFGSWASQPRMWTTSGSCRSARNMPDHRHEEGPRRPRTNLPLIQKHQGLPAMPGASFSAAESVLPPVLLGQTAVAGVIDAVSYLGLGHVFTANMTGNVVFLAFAAAGASGLSVPRSGTALVAFLVGAVVGGWIATRMSAGPWYRWTGVAFGGEAIL